jgi:hypothetical protein
MARRPGVNIGDIRNFGVVTAAASPMGASAVKKHWSGP